MMPEVRQSFDPTRTVPWLAREPVIGYVFNWGLECSLCLCAICVCGDKYKACWKGLNETASFETRALMQGDWGQSFKVRPLAPAS